MSNFIDTLVHNIELRLNQKKWRWADLARASGVSESFLYNIKHKVVKDRTGYQVIYQIAKALGTTMEELTGFPPLYPNMLRRVQEDLRAGNPEVIAAHLRDMNLDPTSIKIVEAMRNLPPLEDWQIEAVRAIIAKTKL